MPDDQSTSSGDALPGQAQNDPSQPVVIRSSEFPTLYATLQYSSADDMLQAIGVDPSTINSDDDPAVV